MSLPKIKSKKADIVKDDMIIRGLIRTEENLTKNWLTNWGWIGEQYRWMEEKMKEHSDKSVWLTRVLKGVAPDERKKLKNFPNTTNHEYGWLGDEKEHKLEKYGPDVFVALPLPNIYSIHSSK